MAKQIEMQTEPITLEIPDLIVGDTVIKRKAKLFTMTYNQHTKQVVLSWGVKSYANNGGKYGEALQVIPDYSVESIADNTIAVNPQTGVKLVKDKDGNYPTDWMGQYDFFYVLGSKVAIKVHDIIKQYGEQQLNWNK